MCMRPVYKGLAVLDDDPFQRERGIRDPARVIPRETFPRNGSSSSPLRYSVSL